MTIAMPLLREPTAGGAPAQPCPLGAPNVAAAPECRAEAARRLRRLTRQLRASSGEEAAACAPATILALFER